MDIVCVIPTVPKLFRDQMEFFRKFSEILKEDGATDVVIIEAYVPIVNLKFYDLDFDVQCCMVPG